MADQNFPDFEATISFRISIEDSENIIQELERLFSKFRKREQLIKSSIKFEARQVQHPLVRMKILNS